jgi:hypothetical protein
MALGDRSLDNEAVTRWLALLSRGDPKTYRARLHFSLKAERPHQAMNDALPETGLYPIFHHRNLAAAAFQ